MKLKILYRVAFIGRPNRRDVILSELSDFTDEEDAFAIQLQAESEGASFPDSITLITIDPPTLGDYYTLTLEKSEPTGDEDDEDDEDDEEYEDESEESEEQEA